MRIPIAPSANPTADIRAAIAAIIASGDPGLIEVGPGTYELAATGQKGNGNGAAIVINSTMNPAGVPIAIRGAGKHLTTFALAAGQPFNLVEVVHDGGGYGNLPFELCGVTLQGNGAPQEPDNAQGTGGDRYQNGFYACGNVGGVRLDLKAVGASFHGVALNAVHKAETNIEAAYNYCNGVLLTGNPAAAMYGERCRHDFLVYGNGIPRPGNVDTTYMGAVIIEQNGCRVRVVSSWHSQHELNAITPNSGGAVLMQCVRGCSVGIVSRGNDRHALTMAHNVIDSDVEVLGTLTTDAGVLDNNMQSATPTRGNTFRFAMRACPVTANLGNGAGNFEDNVIYGSRCDAPVVRGQKFLNNTQYGWNA